MLCKLFGHKYVYTYRRHLHGNRYHGNYIPVLTDFCVRCGHERTEVTQGCKAIPFKQDMTSGTDLLESKE